ncbi:transcription factor [Pyrrhoderma noxium]|uniref:Transcription factor n=1 Tax=Pyrrhoderma noxium TaxID=2282107 RepID=A0A286UA11_9AGAM|nr:transcription factor [Pyrrhoderma noxium]
MPSAAAETKHAYITAHLSDDDDMPEQVFRVPRRTPVACQFCRGRKLKCDGRNICSNCVRRSLACSYVPVSKN